LLVDALMDVQGADLAFSPGFRWGTTLLPGRPSPVNGCWT
jgi:sulfur-oxidizing protein SoxB